MNKTEQAIMASDLAYQKRLAHNNARLLIRADETIKRVRELHKLIVQDNAACGDPDCCGDYDTWDECEQCEKPYPCPTIKALDGEQVIQNKCEQHEWKTYGTLGQQCIKCDFAHDFS